MKKQVIKSTSSLLLIIVLILSLGVSTFALTYDDVTGHWAESYIEKWTNEEVVNGYPDGSFKPNDKVTRGETAAIICRFLELDTEASMSNPYSDVFEDDWYYDEVLACYEDGVMIGNTDGTFSPKNNISRQEAITTIGRAVNLTEGDTGLEEYSDSSDVASFAAGFVNAMIRDGYVNGYPDNTLKPKDNISRAEFVKILYYVNAPISETNPTTAYKLFVKIDDTLDKTVTASTDYLVANDLVAFEFISLIESKYDDFREAFPSNHMKLLLDEGLAAFDDGDSAWSEYVSKYYTDVEEAYYRSSFISVIDNRNALLGDLVAGIQYVMHFDDTQANREGVSYTVTAWIERS